MASMKSRTLFRRGSGKIPEAQAQMGLPVVNYRKPLIVTMLTTSVLFLLIAFLTILSFANIVSSLNPPKTVPDNAATNAFLCVLPGLHILCQTSSTSDGSGNVATSFVFCGVTGIVGLALSVYFLLALSKGVRDLMTPMYYTRGSIADKRSIAGRVAGEWIGVVPSYIGTDVEMASQVTDEQASISADRSRIVNTRGSSTPRPQPLARGSYLSPGRISVGSAPTIRSLDPPAEKQPRRIIFRVDAGAYSQLKTEEEVLVAHSRFIEHIFYVAHLRDGEWESYKNDHLI